MIDLLIIMNLNKVNRICFLLDVYLTNKNTISKLTGSALSGELWLGFNESSRISSLFLLIRCLSLSFSDRPVTTVRNAPRATAAAALCVGVKALNVASVGLFTHKDESKTSLNAERASVV